MDDPRKLLASMNDEERTAQLEEWAGVLSRVLDMDIEDARRAVAKTFANEPGR